MPDSRRFAAAFRVAGRTPEPGPQFTNVQDTLAEIGTGPPSWTFLYQDGAEHLPARRVAVRPLEGVRVSTALAVPPGPPIPALRLLLDACAAIITTGPAGETAGQRALPG